MIETHKAIVAQFFSALGRGDADTLRAILADEVEAICTGSCVLSGPRNADAICAAAAMLAQVAPAGISFQILALTAEADRVSAEVEGRSTLATGQAYDNQYHFLFTFRDGKVTRIKEYMDTLLVERLLGPLIAQAG